MHAPLDFTNTPLEKLPDDIRIQIVSLLTTEEYRNFARVSKVLYKQLTDANFIGRFDPLLATVLRISFYYIEKVFGETFAKTLVPISVFKKIMFVYAEVRTDVVASKIQIDENVFITKLDNFLSQLNGIEKKRLKFNFLNIFFSYYFRSNQNFTFDNEQNFSLADIQKYKSEARDLLGIKKNNDQSFLSHILWETMPPTEQTVKTLKILRKLSKNNSITAVKNLTEEVWHQLILGQHSLEFLDSLDAKIDKLQQLGLIQNSSLLFVIVKSPSAFLLGRILRKEISMPHSPIESVPILMGTNFNFSMEDLLKAYVKFAFFKSYYPKLFFLNFLLENEGNWNDLVPQEASQNQLTKIFSNLSFLVLKQLIIFLKEKPDPKESIQKIFDFLVSSEGADLLGYLKSSRRHSGDVFSQTYFDVLTDNFYYQYFKKANYTIAQILKLSNKRLKIYKAWISERFYLFEAWDAMEVKGFFESLLLCKPGKKAVNKAINKEVFQALCEQEALLKNSRGKIISYQDFFSLVNSKIPLYLKAATCEQLFENLGFENMQECLKIEVTVNNGSKNLLAALGDLDYDKLKSFLEEARGDFTRLKNFVEAKPFQMVSPLQAAASVGFFLAPTPSPKKRGRKQIIIEQLETLVQLAKQAEANDDQARVQEIFKEINALTVMENKPNKSPRLGNNGEEN